MSGATEEKEPRRQMIIESTRVAIMASRAIDMAVRKMFSPAQSEALIALAVEYRERAEKIAKGLRG